jgi:hypothetical protein
MIRNLHWPMEGRPCLYEPEKTDRVVYLDSWV